MHIRRGYKKYTRVCDFETPILLVLNLKPGSQYDAGASVKSLEHNQRRIVNEFYVGTLGALVRATATQGIDSISIRALASVTFR